jgi:hypothetical protein
MGESKKIISALKDSEPDVEIFSVNTDGSIDVKGNINFGGGIYLKAPRNLKHLTGLQKLIV